MSRLVANGKFREDLFYRLSVLELDIPPLRRRTEDIPLLAEAFAVRFGGSGPLGRELLERLAEHPWPGNVRELRNAIERMCALSVGGAPRAEHLPPAVLRSAAVPAASGTIPESEPFLPSRGALPEWLAESERRYIEAALKETGGNKQAAARRLGISRMTLYNRIGALFGGDSPS